MHPLTLTSRGNGFRPPLYTERPVQTLRYSRSLLHRHRFLGPRPLMPRIGRMSGFACVRRGSGNEVADLLPECGRQGAAAKRRWESIWSRVRRYPSRCRCASREPGLGRVLSGRQRHRGNPALGMPSRRRPDLRPGSEHLRHCPAEHPHSGRSSKTSARPTLPQPSLPWREGRADLERSSPGSPHSWEPNGEPSSVGTRLHRSYSSVRFLRSSIYRTTASHIGRRNVSRSHRGISLIRL